MKEQIENMSRYMIEKKRVVVRGEKKDWQSIMRQVGGRHYTNLKGNGPAWTFAKDHLEKFLALSNHFSSSSSSEHDNDDDVSEQQSDDTGSSGSRSGMTCIIDENKDFADYWSPPSPSRLVVREPPIVENDPHETDVSEVEQKSSSSEHDDSQDMEEEEKIEVSSVSTQTDTHPTYLYDVDEQTQQFISQWLLSAGVATSV